MSNQCSVAVYALGTPAETPNTIKLWKSRETTIVLILTVDQRAKLRRTPGPIMPGKGVIYWNLQCDVPLGGMDYFAPWLRGKPSVFTGILLSCCKPDLLKCTLPGMARAALREGRRCRSSSAISSQSCLPRPAWRVCTTGSDV